MLIELSTHAVDWWAHLATGVALLICCWTIRWRPLHSKLPKKFGTHLPFVGAARFWTERWTFFKQGIASTSTGNFSFWAGPYPVVGLSGDESRHVFYNTKQLGLAEGYAILGGKMPSTHVEGEEGEDIWPKQEFLTYMKERVRRMLQREPLRKRLPILIKDTKFRLDELGSVFNPFDAIYRLIFLMMVRSIGSYDICEDRDMIESLMDHYNKFSSCASTSVIIFPWLPSPSLVRRYYHGAQLFFGFSKIVKERQKKTADGVQVYDDPLQELINQKCGTSHIVGVLLGAIFAGQQNTSVNAGWILIHLVHNKFWADKVREEIVQVACKYDPDETKPLRERLDSLPLEAWETEFPTIELCVKENLRLHGLGSQIRRNTGAAMVLPSGEAIPPDAFVSYHTADVHLNASVYRHPLSWDPARYLPDRAEHTQKPLAWVGWGSGKHVCLGMKLAQLQLHLIVAMFFATFEEAHLCDSQGRLQLELPPINLESWISERPKGGSAYITLKRRGSQIR